ncbi:YjbH domain-containing protein [Vibrio chagasii]|uniref:YjbH domain-containing protein n=1 Tax=Vibrio chagasii TaxID=170679 RepID=UPI001EFD2125|nr:YjbH domain-containing protein [Vibrio chagasii]MCG9565848.1 YjbH domain-containing protein [Vibrio chagasii]
MKILSHSRNAALIAFLSALVIAPNAYAVDNLMSSQSYTGAIIVPNAQVMDTGDISYLYGQGVPYKGKTSELDNILFSVGLFEGFEAAGRIVTKTYDCHLYTNVPNYNPNCGNGIRDLSASFKYQLPFVKDWTGFDLAVGVQDLGGAASNFETFYAVADFEPDFVPARFSAGYGKSEVSHGVLNGPFASLEYQPLDFVQLIAEHDSHQFNAGLKVFTPEHYLPLDTQLSFQYQFYTSGNADIDIWSVAASTPLMGFSESRRVNELTLEDKIAVEQAHHKFAGLVQLKKALVDEGFLNVRISVDDIGLNVALENRRYNRNQVDGVGVALGIISSYVGEGMLQDLGIKNYQQQNIRLFNLVNDMPMMEVITSAPCYREFVKTGGPCKTLLVRTSDVKKSYAKANFGEEVTRSGFGRTQVIVSPALYHNTATEYGVFDYSLALATNLYTPLWKGAALDLRHVMPLAESDDFEEGRIWGDDAFENEVDRVLFHQAFQLPYNLTTQFSFGQVYGNYLGALNETQYASNSGRHILGAEFANFSAQDKFDSRGKAILDATPMIGHYTYSRPDWNWQGKVQAGQFWKGDEGVRVTTSHWLGDVRVDASYQTTKAVGKSEYEDFVTLGIAIPLTLWRDMSPGYVQLRGIDQFVYALQTRVGESHNQLGTGLGVDTGLQHNIERQYFNRNRIGASYYHENRQRLRNAYLKYLESVK